MIKFFEKILEITVGIITVAFMFLPEAFFRMWEIIPQASSMINIILNRILFFVLVLVLVGIFTYLYFHFRTKVYIKGKGYEIQVEYGNIFDAPKEAKKVITFDECFTTDVGDKPEQIKPKSLCGQYLNKFPLSKEEMQKLIDDSHLKPLKESSEYKNTQRYEAGSIVPRGDYLLMAFAKLDKNGSALYISQKEYLDCLSIMWKGLCMYYSYEDVYIPIIASGKTRMSGMRMTTQQELLDTIIESYRLSDYKIDIKNRLHIVCQRCDGFSLNKIGQTL